jgi:hypothetical protein
MFVVHHAVPKQQTSPYVELSVISGFSELKIRDPQKIWSKFEYIGRLMKFLWLCSKEFRSFGI